MTTRRVAVVTAGLRAPSSTRMLADRLGEATLRALEQRGVRAELTVVDLREHAHDLTNMLLTGFASPQLAAAISSVVTVDGVIAVTPIFSGSYNGLFKSFFDVLDDGSLAGTPVLLGATAGTARHSLAIEHAMRPLMAYLRALVVPTGVFAATGDFGAVGTGEDAGTASDVDPLGLRVDRAARELAELVASRPPKATPDEFADLTPFEAMLAGPASSAPRSEPRSPRESR